MIPAVLLSQEIDANMQDMMQSSSFGRQCRQHSRPPKPEAVRIYEAHVGMSSEDPTVATYAHFRGIWNLTLRIAHTQSLLHIIK